ncbi:hypothetical protein DJFAAGMI_04874 [Comamonas sp. PE63]|uniref:Glycosyltransferase 2-like domain-containing protein n=1 Tax=Comamonas brasiliensis TaxID=1812482 RepID=A0ABS5LZZ0_9BURK|nr:glycosyltransferase [Comamonas sp. PE63]MBS3022093.1 hypothetical protein [Comamonas sp. PE63]
MAIAPCRRGSLVFHHLSALKMKNLTIIKNNDNPPPLVSILMATYNHAPYIEQALKSILEQKTSFDFELVVCDDASTDKTADIVKEFQKKYKNLTLLEQPSNSRGINNHFDGYQYISSKYIAFCEGDDYWVSDTKLEKQINFLEENPDFSVCVHKVEMQFEKATSNQKQYVYKDLTSSDERIREGVFYADELISNYFLHTSSFVFRYRFSEGLPKWFRKWMTFDHAILMLHAVEGKTKYFDEVMSVWRRNETGFSWLQNVDKGTFFQKEGHGWINIYQEMDRFFAGRFHYQIRERILLSIRNMVSNHLETGNLPAAQRILEKYEEWCSKFFKENAPIFHAMELAFPDNKNYAPPWQTIKSSQPKNKKVGGMKKLDVEIISEVEDSIWQSWTKDKEFSTFSSFNSALISWAYNQRIKTLWLPSTIASTLIEQLDTLKIPYYIYCVNGDFSPNIDFIEQAKSGDAILIQSWLGQPFPANINNAIATRKNIYWIEDRSQTSTPSHSNEADVTIYTPAQVLGVPDGCILVGDGLSSLQEIAPEAITDENSWIEQRQKLLVQQLDCNSQDYSEVLGQAITIKNPMPVGAMSSLSMAMLKRISAPSVISRTQRNFNFLNEKLGNYSFLKKNKNINFAPNFFPFVLPDHIPAPFFITALHHHGILCEAVSNQLKEVGALTLLVSKIVLLPCNHQLNPEDVELISNEVLKILGGNSRFGTPGTRPA